MNNPLIIAAGVALTILLCRAALSWWRSIVLSRILSESAQAAPELKSKNLRPPLSAVRVLVALRHLHSVTMKMAGGEARVDVAWQFVSSVRAELLRSVQQGDTRLFDEYVSTIRRNRSLASQATLSELQTAHNEFIGERGPQGPAGLMRAALGGEFERQWQSYTSSLYLYHVTSALFLRRIMKSGLAVAAMPKQIASAIQGASEAYRRCGLVGGGRFDIVEDLASRPIYCRATADLFKSKEMARMLAGAEGLPAFAYELLDQGHAQREMRGRKPSDRDEVILRRAWRVGRIVRRFSRMIPLRIRVTPELLEREGAADCFEIESYFEHIFAPHVNDLLMEHTMVAGLAESTLTPVPEKTLPYAFRVSKSFAFDIPLDHPVPSAEIDVLVRPSGRTGRRWIPLIGLAEQDFGRVVELDKRARKGS